MSDRQMYDVKDLAKLLRCSERHIYRMVADDNIPAPVKLGQLNRWPVATIEAWIAAGCPETKAKANKGVANEQQ